MWSVHVSRLPLNGLRPTILGEMKAVRKITAWIEMNIFIIIPGAG